MPSPAGLPHSVRPEAYVRLHYLDWLRVLAIVGVFLFHAVHPFDFFGWHIKNAEKSMAVTVFIAFFAPWGMPFFFMMAGAGSWFALQRRTARLYLRERFTRLLIPFIAGSILLMPVMLYFEWRHGIWTGSLRDPFLQYALSREVDYGPGFFAWAGYHLWFLGFLFSFSLITLPLFLWLKGEKGRAVLSAFARWCERRGGILIVIVPLLLVQLALRPFFPDEHNMADFVFRMSFFVLGFMLFADERFARAIKRDWPSVLAVGIASLAGLLMMLAAGMVAWLETPSLPGFYLLWSLITIDGWCWSIVALFLGMRLLNFSNRWLRYGQEAVLPLFVVHQPVIIVLAFYVVQWNASISGKLPVVVLGSLAVSVGLYELIIKRIDPLRPLFGMKPLRSR